jgi:hypothetical protein
MKTTNKKIIDKAINELSLIAVNRLIRGKSISKLLSIIKDLEGIK